MPARAPGGLSSEHIAEHREHFKHFHARFLASLFCSTCRGRPVRQQRQTRPVTSHHHLLINALFLLHQRPLPIRQRLDRQFPSRYLSPYRSSRAGDKWEWKWPDQTGHLLAGLQLDGHKMFVVIFSERLWLREEGERGQRGQLEQAASMVVRLGPTKSSADSLALHHMFSLPLELGNVGHTQVVIISATPTVGWLSVCCATLMRCAHSRQCLTSHPTQPTPPTPTHHRVEETGAEALYVPG